MANKFILFTGEVNGNHRKVKLSGVDMSRFMANPLMYYNHDSSRPPIGRWQNIKLETINGVACYTAEAIFDVKDNLGKEIARKVADGFINSVSIGYIIIDVTSSNNLDEVNKCQVLEASIVDLPANQNAVKVDFIANSYHKDIFQTNLPVDTQILDGLNSLDNLDNGVANIDDSSKIITYNFMNITKGLTDFLSFFKISSVKTDEKDNLVLTDSQVEDMNKKVADLQQQYQDSQSKLASVILEKDTLQVSLDAATTKNTALDAEIVSLKADNAAKLFSMPDIDGGLVGGASLNTDEFVAICQAASNS